MNKITGWQKEQDVNMLGKLQKSTYGRKVHMVGSSFSLGSREEKIKTTMIGPIHLKSTAQIVA